MATGTPGTTARQLPYQVVHYLRFTVNFNDTGIATGTGKQTLPAGAIIVGTDVIIQTAFNAGTTNVVTIGSNAATFNNIVAAADVDESGAVPLTQNIKPTGTAFGPLAADARVFAMYTQTGTAATAGRLTVIIKYIPANDL